MTTVVKVNCTPGSGQGNDPYTHVTRQMQESAAEKMGNFMAQVM